LKSATPYVRVISGLDRERISALIAGAAIIHDRLLENASIFVAPSPTLPVLAGQIGDLSQAHLDMRHQKDGRGTCLLKRNILWSSIRSEVAMVQTLVDQAPEQGGVYAAAAGMRLADSTAYDKPPIKAKLTDVPGTVFVAANAGLILGASLKVTRQRSFFWRYSVSQTQVYVDAGSTPIAHTLIEGVPLNVPVGFEVAAKDSKGLGTWSQPFVLFVHA
jgi:hypothetical protein